MMLLRKADIIPSPIMIHHHHWIRRILPVWNYFPPAGTAPAPSVVTDTLVLVGYFGCWYPSRLRSLSVAFAALRATIAALPTVVAAMSKRSLWKNKVELAPSKR
mmetsp:Transcript_8172/g.18957  ORF Transcript_8172/g.18957 Transcript_8172/m.18957 type:complete len:104 (-) Transcript_8172:99-410(-)